MWVSEIREAHLTNDLVDRLLFEGMEDNGEEADCIIVLGSQKASEYRVPVAVQAYHDRRSSKVLLCGGVVRNFAGVSMSEAENMHMTAIEMGVPESALIVENDSKNTVENALCALLCLQRSLWLNNVHRILLVTTSYHMRRSLHLFRYLFPSHICIIPCPADDTSTRRDNWMHSEKGINRAKGEVMNIVRCVHNGVIPDFEI